MLLRFACKNIRSLRDEQEFTLIADSGHEREDTVIQIPAIGHRLLRSAAIYGANASGKTNLLRALSFFAAMVENSFSRGSATSPIPRARFLLNDDKESPSYFEIDFLLKNERFTFGCELNDSEVLREWLYTYPSGRKVVWYEREHGQPMVFGRRLTGKNRVIESLTRKNSLFLSAAAQNNHEQLTPVYEWFSNGFSVATADTRQPLTTADFCSSSVSSTELVRTLIKFADLGIVDFKISEQEVDKKMFEMFSLMKEKSIIDSPEIPRTMRKINLVHEGAAAKLYEIDAMDESDGTMAYFSILGPILRALATGTVLLIDELESSLHPALARELVKIFNDPKVNCHGAQFIFTTHDANLLSLEVLRRDQIWFTEKNREGATSLYPLTDFSVRNDYNIARGYLQGRFGAIPFFNEALFAELKGMPCE
jgi:uncharacterized protein